MAQQIILCLNTTHDYHNCYGLELCILLRIILQIYVKMFNTHRVSLEL